MLLYNKKRAMNPRFFSSFAWEKIRISMPFKKSYGFNRDDSSKNNYSWVILTRVKVRRRFAEINIKVHASIQKINYVIKAWKLYSEDNLFSRQIIYKNVPIARRIFIQIPIIIMCNFSSYTRFFKITLEISTGIVFNSLSKRC